MIIMILTTLFYASLRLQQQHVTKCVHRYTNNNKSLKLQEIMKQS